MDPEATTFLNPGTYTQNKVPLILKVSQIKGGKMHVRKIRWPYYFRLTLSIYIFVSACKIFSLKKNFSTHGANNNWSEATGVHFKDGNMKVFELTAL